MLFIILTTFWQRSSEGYSIRTYHSISPRFGVYLYLPQAHSMILRSQQGPQNLVPTLLSPIGTSTYSATSAFWSLQEMLEALLHHIKPKRVVNAHHFHNELTTMPVHANSRKQHAMHVERRATLLQHANERTTGPQSQPNKAMGSSTVLINIVLRRPQPRRTQAVMSTSCTSWV